jgi:hypothetical protein
MNVLVNGQIKGLSIRDRNGIDWTQDLIGNCGYGDAGFTWNDDAEMYETSEENFTWWETYIEGQEEVDAKVDELIDAGWDRDYVMQVVMEAVSYANDYDQHYGMAMDALEKIGS